MHSIDVFDSIETRCGVTIDSVSALSVSIPIGHWLSCSLPTAHTFTFYKYYTIACYRVCRVV